MFHNCPSGLREFYEELAQLIPDKRHEIKVRLSKGDGGLVLVGSTLFFYRGMWKETQEAKKSTSYLSDSIGQIHVCGTPVEIYSQIEGLLAEAA